MAGPPLRDASYGSTYTSFGGPSPRHDSRRPLTAGDGSQAPSLSQARAYFSSVQAPASYQPGRFPATPPESFLPAPVGSPEWAGVGYSAPPPGWVAQTGFYIPLDELPRGFVPQSLSNFYPIDPYTFLSYGMVAGKRTFLGHMYHQLSLQLYRHLLLRIPSMYFTRVSKVFKESGVVGEPDIEALKNADPAPKLMMFRNRWESFVNTMVKERKTLNVVSALLLSALLTMLQISDAAAEPITRTAILLSLVCALMSLSYGCVYIVRFGTMSSMYKAAGFALDIHRRKTSMWWNVLVLLAMPAVWLAWSMFFFCVSVMSYVWTAGSRDDEQRLLARRAEFGPRAAVSALFLLGLIYFVLVVHTFQSYGVKPHCDERIMEAGHSESTTSEHHLVEPVTFVIPPLPIIVAPPLSTWSSSSLRTSRTSSPETAIYLRTTTPEFPFGVPVGGTISPPITDVVPLRFISPIFSPRARRAPSPDTAHPRLSVAPPSTDSESIWGSPSQPNTQGHSPRTNIPGADYGALQETIRTWRAGLPVEPVADPAVPSASSRGRSPVPPHAVLPLRRRASSDSSESKDSESFGHVVGVTQRSPGGRMPPPGAPDIDYGAANELIRERHESRQVVRPWSPTIPPSALRPRRSLSTSERDRVIAAPGNISGGGDTSGRPLGWTPAPPLVDPTRMRVSRASSL